MTNEQLERLTAQADTPAQVMRYIHDQTEAVTNKTFWVEYIEPMPSEAGADLLIRTWTFKKTKRHGLEHMEVIRRIVGEEVYSARCLDFMPVAGWSTCYDYPDEPWQTYEDKMLRQERPLLNPEILATMPETRGNTSPNTRPTKRSSILERWASSPTRLCSARPSRTDSSGAGSTTTTTPSQ